jgi:hypothetical protein
VAGGLLNELGLRIRENHMKFEEGENTSVLANGMRVKFYRSNGSETLYLLLPDPKGILPEEDGCSKPYCYQKIYADIIEEDER